MVPLRAGTISSEVAEVEEAAPVTAALQLTVEELPPQDGESLLREDSRVEPQVGSGRTRSPPAEAPMPITTDNRRCVLVIVADCNEPT